MSKRTSRDDDKEWDRMLEDARRVAKREAALVPNAFVLDGLSAQERKTYPLYSGLIKYFPNALLLMAHHSYVSNEQHNPGQELHWEMSKSKDELDALGRHIMEKEWVSVAWRGVANLEREYLKGYRP